MTDQIPCRWNVTTTVEGFTALRPEWETLFNSNAAHSPFLTWGWTAAWLRHLAGPHELRILEGRDESGRLALLIPLIKRPGNRIPLINACGYGPDCSDHLGAIHRPELQSNLPELIAQGIVSNLENDQGFCLASLATMDQLPQNIASGLERSGHRHTIVKLSPCPTTRLPGSIEEFYLGLSKNFRSQIRRQRRKVLQTENTALRQYERRDTEVFVEALIRLNRARLAAKGETSSLEDERFCQFMYDATDYMAQTGRAWMDVVESDGLIIGAALNFIHGNTVSYYMGGFESGNSGLSPGNALFATVIERAIQEDFESYDFLRGSEPYKYRWGATDVVDISVTVYPNSLVTGKIPWLVDSMRTAGRKLLRRPK